LYGDRPQTGYGIGGAGYLTRRFNSHLGITGLIGYSQLPFKISDTTKTIKADLTTQALRGDLLFDYEISSSTVRPYIGLGIGVVSAKITGGKAASGKTLKSKSYNSFAFGPSAGLRVMLGSRFALDLGGSFRLTTSDSLYENPLNPKASNKAKDGIITGMLGITFFSGGQGTDILAEQTPVDESPTDDLLDFQQRIDQMESAPPQQPQDMQEYVRLKSKMDEMNQQIGQKEEEINSLRTALAAKEQSVNTMQTQLTSSSGNSASFSRGYEEALSKFYGKRYSEAIAQFSGLVIQFPDHPRVSNCVYWIGEAQFGSGNYQEAANAFNRVLNYPRSLKKDDALLMLGRSYLQLNQKDEARQTFNRLIQEFPNSEFVAKAEEWLNRM
jgi:tol-pal system protein YbgF